MDDQEPPSIKGADWRFQAITTIAKDWKSPNTGIEHKKGARIELVGFVALDEKTTLGFPLPNAVALFLNFSYKLWEESTRVIGQLDFFKGDSLLKPQSDSNLFDVIEQRMGAIVFAFSALESFANEFIPSDHVHTKTREDERCTESYTKEQIERFISLDTKLGNILPPIMNVNSPKGKDLWERYLRIKNLRDRIIHLKAKDRRSLKPRDDSIWQAILNKKQTNIALDAKELIGYFLHKLPKDKKPRWFIKIPF